MHVEKQAASIADLGNSDIAILGSLFMNCLGLG
jgi:hypothetical protein